MPGFLRASTSAKAGGVGSLLAGERGGGSAGLSGGAVAGWRPYGVLAAGGALVALVWMLAASMARPAPLAVRSAPSADPSGNVRKYQRLGDHPLVHFSTMRDFARLRKVYMQWEMPPLDGLEDLPAGEVAPKRLMMPEMLRQEGGDGER